MKGRESLDSLQAFLEAVIIQCFTAKYALLPKRREAVAPMEMELWNLFRAQEEYFKGDFLEYILNFNSNEFIFLLFVSHM